MTRNDARCSLTGSSGAMVIRASQKGWPRQRWRIAMPITKTSQITNTIPTAGYAVKIAMMMGSGMNKKRPAQ